MALVFGTRGNCLEAKFSGHISAAEVFTLWNQLADEIECALVVLHDLTEIPLATEFQASAAQAARAPISRLAFVGKGNVAYGFARMLALLCGVPNGYGVFTHEADALLWLSRP